MMEERRMSESKVESESHITTLAAELGLTRILVPRNSSIFCAAGLLLSDLRHDLVRTYVTPFEQADRDRLRAMVRALAADGRAALQADGVAGSQASLSFACDVRYLGQYH